MVRIIPSVLVFALWVYCLVDVIGTRDDRVRNLPKVAWIIIVLLFPFVGSVVWLLAGRPAKAAPLTREQGAAPGFSEYERRGRFAAADPEKDEEFLRQIRERAEQQRQAYEEQKKREREEQDDPEA